MSLFRPSDECPKCFRLTGFAGDYARRDPRRARLACHCDDELKIEGHVRDHGFAPDEQLTELRGDPFLNRRAA